MPNSIGFFYPCEKNTCRKQCNKGKVYFSSQFEESSVLWQELRWRSVKELVTLCWNAGSQHSPFFLCIYYKKIPSHGLVQHIYRVHFLTSVKLAQIWNTCLELLRAVSPRWLHTHSTWQKCLAIKPKLYFNMLFSPASVSTLSNCIVPHFPNSMWPGLNSHLVPTVFIQIPFGHRATNWLGMLSKLEFIIRIPKFYVPSVFLKLLTM